MISVVIPLYNKHHTIERTIQSVLLQQYKLFEVIVVDDGSTDNSVNVVTKIIDSRIKIFKQDNQGVSIARNNGVKKAQFEYIAFLDGDDQWLPDYLSTIHEAIIKFPDAGMFCCAGITRNKQGDHIRLAKKYERKIIEINFFENPHVFLHTSAAVVSKKQFVKAGGFPLHMKRNQDFAFFYSVALLTPVVYCGFPLSIYVGDVEGQATSNSPEKVVTHIINRYNYTFTSFENSGKKNKLFKIFMKYELRHDMLVKILNKNYNGIKLYFKNLSPSIIHLFSKLERILYTNKFLKPFALIYIYSTKIRWKLRGFPTVNA